MGESARLWAGVSDAAVRKATGQGWDSWFRRIDAADGLNLTHAQIARHLQEAQGCSQWWSQMITVGYEQARGRRVKHQKSDGFSISVTRTIGASAEVVYQAWMDGQRRRHWLPRAKFQVTSTREARSLRMVWSVDDSRLEVQITARTEAQCTLCVQHNRLANAEASAEARAFWKAALDRLRDLVESRA